MSAVHLTDHALERFQQRVRPGLTFEQAEDELARLLEEFGEWGECPDWYDGDDFLSARWLWLGDDIAIPVQPSEWGDCECTVTILIPSGFRPGARLHLTRAKRNQRQARRAREDPSKRREAAREQKQHRTRQRRWKEDGS